MNLSDLTVSHLCPNNNADSAKSDSVRHRREDHFPVTLHIHHDLCLSFASSRALSSFKRATDDHKRIHGRVGDEQVDGFRVTRPIVDVMKAGNPSIEPAPGELVCLGSMISSALP